MKSLSTIVGIILTGLLLSVLICCKKETTKVIPTLTSATVTNITTNSATAGGEVTSDGGVTVTTRGVCWTSTNTLPTIDDNKTTDGSGLGPFSGPITGLAPGTTYHIRAYATNSVGTAYGNESSFITNPLINSSSTDIDGNTYSSVIIGTQVWMTSNLKTTKLNDGTAIPLITNRFLWEIPTSPQYCWNSQIATNKDQYGPLYNWYAVRTGKLCPTGWHVPSDEELKILTTYLGGEAVAGGKLKETGTSHWRSPNLATNETGFSALSGGLSNTNMDFMGTGQGGFWWSSSFYLYDNARNWEMTNDKTTLFRNAINVKCGLSVRCVKN